MVLAFSYQNNTYALLWGQILTAQHFFGLSFGLTQTLAACPLGGLILLCVMQKTHFNVVWVIYKKMFYTII